MRVEEIRAGQVWVWRNQSDGSEHSRRVVNVEDGRVWYVLDGGREIAAPVEEFRGALINQHARLARLETGCEL